MDECGYVECEDVSGRQRFVADVIDYVHHGPEHVSSMEGCVVRIRGMRGVAVPSV